MADEEQRLRDIQREYLDFLDDEVSGGRAAELNFAFFFSSQPMRIAMIIAGGSRHIHGAGEKYDRRQSEASRCQH